MPPWARQPTTSYWPPTSAPGAAACGSKSNGVRHFGQKPLVRPADALARAADRCAAHRAEALVLGDHRRVHQRLARIDDRAPTAPG